MDSLNRTLNGRCACGNIEYSVEDAFEYALNCHCSGCRRSTGSAFKPFAGIRAERLDMPAEAAGHLLVVGKGPNQDVRCAACGSLLYSVVRERTYVHVALGTLIDEPSIRPSAHIFVGSRAPWFSITDDLPQHQSFA